MRGDRQQGEEPFTVSMIRAGDEPLHHHDGSHRWACPYPDEDMDTWHSKVQAHVSDHRHTPDTPDHLIGVQKLFSMGSVIPPDGGRRRRRVKPPPSGYEQIMSEHFEPPPNAPDQVDDQVSDVLNEDAVVHVPSGVEQLVESHEATSTYAPDVPHWEPGEPPEAADR